MNCPSCHVALSSFELEPDLSARRCGACQGIWVALAEYHTWRATQEGDLPEVPLAEIAERSVSAETGRGKLCPECGHVLLPYRIGHDVSFTLDHCGSCGGTWFERGEWEELKARNLHDNIHQMFTRPWQTEVTREDRARDHERNLIARFGEEDYFRAKEFRAWVAAHAHRDALRAYLISSDEE